MKLTTAFCLLASAYGDVPQGSYPSFTPEMIAEEFPEIANEYIVVFKKGAEQTHIDAHLQTVQGMSATVHKNWHISNEDSAKEFRGYHMTVEGTSVAALKAKFGDSVQSVEANAVVKASKARKADCTMQSGATWGIVRTAEKQNDKNSFYSYGADGAGVTAYVIDTGIRCSHSEFKGRCKWGFDSANFPSPNTDLNGHGTHVAGTIGGTVYGLAKKVNLVGVAVLSAGGSGSTAGVVSGVEYSANDAKGKRAVGNMSLGGGYSAASNAAVDSAKANGLAMFVASGNSNTNSCSFSPASADGAYTVDSSDNADRRSSFSNYGSCSNIVAPGSAITAAWIQSDSSINTISGTSMASPHVAGVAAKMLAESNMSPDQLYSEITKNANSGMISGFPNNPQPLLFLDCEQNRAKFHSNNLRATIA